MFKTTKTMNENSTILEAINLAEQIKNECKSPEVKAAADRLIYGLSQREAQVSRKSVNEKKHTLARRLNTMLNPEPTKESINWLGLALAAVMVALIVVSIALGRAWDDNRRMSEQIGQLHKTK